MPDKEQTESKVGKANKDLGSTPDQPTVTVTVSPPLTLSACSTDDTTDRKTVTVTVKFEFQYPGHP
jgi:hypothetical protein